jgi:acyl-CoA thioesterase
MGDLEADTHVDGRDGEYHAEVSRDWEIWGPNGGYIASLALRAAGAHTEFDRPASLVGHFLGVADFRTVTARVTTLRKARRAESMQVEITQDDRPVFTALVWAITEPEGLDHDLVTSPARHDPATLPTIRERLGDAYDGGPYHRFWSNFDECVPDEDWIEDWESRPARDPDWGHWYRFVPSSTFADPWVDACRYTILLDTLGWPAVCQLYPKNDFIAPSIDLTCAYHRARPEDEWLFAQATAKSAANGLIGCENKVWARDGSLLAVGTSQLLCRPAPAPPPQ